MRDLARKFEKYLFENLGLSTHLTPWSKQKSLPYFLRDLYTMYECQLLSQPWLVMSARDGEEVTPATIRKHIEQLQKTWAHEVLYLHPTLSSYNRKRLIEQKISFVVPGNQMYLPMFGVDLREHIRNARTVSPKKFSPATQVVLLSILYNLPRDGVNPAQLAEKLSYTRMTMTRAFDEIEATGLADVCMESRERVLRYEGERNHLWEKSLELMRTPVSKRIQVLMPHTNLPLIPAGESALARHSMLAEPPNPAYAMSSETWKAMQQAEDLRELKIHEPGSIEIEIWKYPPELFVRNGTVDPLSLYLSLKGTTDERVEIALDELLEKFPW